VIFITSGCFGIYKFCDRLDNFYSSKIRWKATVLRLHSIRNIQISHDRFEYWPRCLIPNNIRLGMNIRTIHSQGEIIIALNAEFNSSLESHFVSTHSWQTSSIATRFQRCDASSHVTCAWLQIGYLSHEDEYSSNDDYVGNLTLGSPSRIHAQLTIPSRIANSFRFSDSDSSTIALSNLMDNVLITRKVSLGFADQREEECRRQVTCHALSGWFCTCL